MRVSGYVRDTPFAVLDEENYSLDNVECVQHPVLLPPDNQCVLIDCTVRIARQRLTLGQRCDGLVDHIPEALDARTISVWLWGH